MKLFLTQKVLRVISLGLFIVSLGFTASAVQSSISPAVIKLSEVDEYNFPPGRWGDCPLTPTLYKSRDGRGRIVRLEASTPRIGRSHGFANEAGAGCTPNDRAMILYAGRNYNGRSLTIEPGTIVPRFSDGINNNVTSVRLYEVLPDGSWQLIPEQ